ncbi:hypothetical protein F0U60_10300 [Archangium minus]|uniref:Lipoprotein n=1 Tax=Archangium minus TaxID=83450 RepID=A0ABY9WMH3_9BACT|nr:hypothetical protein F0U61_10270 [Archangium violaceum]WNG44458.1 hypothetical protein F0U60_10300 [Archangium minus]
MRKLLGGVCLSIWAGVSCGGSPGVVAEGTERTVRALSSTLPPVEDYPAGAPLPVVAYTHLVVGYCKSLDDFMAVGVDAATGTVRFRFQGNDPTSTSRFMALAYSAGVPLTVYTTPVEVLLEEESQPAASGASQVPQLPMTAGTYYTCVPSSEIGDRPPEEPPTGGNPVAERWELFTELALNTARALHRVARLPAPQ